MNKAKPKFHAPKVRIVHISPKNMSINTVENVNKFLLLKTKQFANNKQTAFTQFPSTQNLPLSFQQKAPMEILFVISINS